MSESEQKRVYSADEIRRVADRLEASGAAKELYLMVGNSLANDEYHGSDIVAMLRQAADAESELGTLKARVAELKANGMVPRLNCEKYPSYESALEAFLAFCPSEQGKPCEGCPYEVEYSCMGRWLMDQEKGA